MYSINVLVITYNQHDVITRALDSVLRQKEYGLNKIIICDDCSTDNNAEVIQRYVDSHQSLIELYVNEKNLGIFGNLNKIIDLKGSADFYVFLSGDDSFCDGYFKTIQDVLSQEKISIKDKAVAVYSDWKMVDTRGVETVYRNDKVKDKRHNLMDYRLRGLIFERSVFLSSKLIHQFKPVDYSHGVPYAELTYDSQTAKYAENAYYVPYVASIYYSGIGFSTKTYNKSYREQYLFAHKALLESQSWSSKNENLIKAMIEKDNAILNRSVVSLLKYINYYLRSGSFRMGCSLRKFCHGVGSVLIKNIIQGKYS